MLNVGAPTIERNVGVSTIALLTQDNFDMEEKNPIGRAHKLVSRETELVRTSVPFE
jgi:hypothetical protein